MKRSQRAGTISADLAEEVKKNLWANKPSTGPSGAYLKITVAKQCLHLGSDKFKMNHYFYYFTL